MTIIRHLALMAIKGAHVVTALRYSVENYNTMLLIGIVAQRPNMPNGN